MEEKKYKDIPIEQEKYVYFLTKIIALEQAVETALPILEDYAHTLGFGEVCRNTKKSITICRNALEMKYQK